MARPRKAKYQGLPPNLHYDEAHQVYRYRHPLTNKYHYMGNDKTKAVSAAKQLNSLLMPGQDLIAKVMGTTQTLDHYIREHFETTILAERKLAASTKENYIIKLKHIKQNLGHTVIDAISVKQISDFLAQFPPTQSNRYRSLLIIIFKHAVAEGLCPDNPAESTLNRKLVKQRGRLSAIAFTAIYQYAEPWLQNAMDLALLTLQRREDIAKMQFNDIKDGHLYVIQKKTEKHGQSAYIKIKIGSSLQKVLTRCRDTVLSAYLIHRLPTKLTWKTKSSKATCVTPDYISKSFATARDLCGLFDDLKTSQKPSFHEIRSLGIKLYEDAGVDAQFLAGHKSRAMTDHYKAGHEVQWTEAEACLDLQVVTNLSS